MHFFFFFSRQDLKIKETQEMRDFSSGWEVSKTTFKGVTKIPHTSLETRVAEGKRLGWQSGAVDRWVCLVQHCAASLGICFFVFQGHGQGLPKTPSLSAHYLDWFTLGNNCHVPNARDLHRVLGTCVLSLNHPFQGVLDVPGFE